MDGLNVAPVEVNIFSSYDQCQMSSTNYNDIFSTDQNTRRDDSEDNCYDFPEININPIADDLDCDTNLFEFNGETSETFEACNDMKKFLTTLTNQISRLQNCLQR